MPQSEEYIFQLEEEIARLENEKQHVAEYFANLKKKYEQIKEREIDLFQEVQELKKNNPFKLEAIYNEKKQDPNEIFQLFVTLLANNEIQNFVDSKLTDVHSAKKIKIDYCPLVKIVQDLIEKYSTIRKEEQKIDLKKPYQFITNFYFDYYEDKLNIMIEDIYFSVQSEKLIKYGKELENKMNEKKEKKSNSDNLELNLFDNEIDISPKSSEHATIEQLKKEMNEIKELLKEKNDREMDTAADNKKSIEDEPTYKKQKQRITFRDIQNA